MHLNHRKEPIRTSRYISSIIICVTRGSFQTEYLNEDDADLIVRSMCAFSLINKQQKQTRLTPIHQG